MHLKLIWGALLDSLTLRCPIEEVEPFSATVEIRVIHVDGTFRGLSVEIILLKISNLNKAVNDLVCLFCCPFHLVCRKDIVCFYYF